MITPESQVCSRKTAQHLVAIGLLELRDFQASKRWFNAWDKEHASYMWLIDDGCFKGDIPALTLMELLDLLGYFKAGAIKRLFMRIRYGYDVEKLANALIKSLKKEQHA